MAGLLDYLSNLKYEPDAASMGLMNMGAQMMANSGPSRMPTSALQQLGGGIQGFNQGYTAQKNEEQALALAEQKKLLDAAAINKDNAMASYYSSGGAGSDGYHQPIQTAQGWAKWDPATNDYKLIELPNGVALPVAADVGLKGRMSAAGHAWDPQQTTDSLGHPMVKPTFEMNGAYPNPNQDMQLPQFNGNEQQLIDQLNNNVAPANNIINTQNGNPQQPLVNNTYQPPQQNTGLPQSPAERAQSLVPAAVAQVGQSEAAKIEAEAQAKAHLELPNNIAQAQNLSDLTKQMLNHPGLPGVVGMPNFQGVMPFPGTNEADFKALLEQVKGKAFLQAFDSLKGGGAISEAEGIKASQALAKLQTSQTEGSFKNSLKEFNNIVSNSANRMKQRAGGSNSLNTLPQNQPSIDDLVNHYGGGK